VIFDEQASSPADHEAVSPEMPAADGQTGSRRMGRRGLLTSAAAVSLTSIAGLSGEQAASAASSPAADEPDPAATGFDQPLWDRQGMLSDLREWIVALPGIESSGYITNINDPDAGSTVLVWHGPSDRIQEQIVDEARRRRIPLSIQQRKYALAALDGGVERLETIASGTGVFRNFEVSGLASIDIDFDGIVVIGDYIEPPVEGVAAADAALIQALSAITGVAVAIEHGKFESLNF
jgi:hypothetical protein